MKYLQSVKDQAKSLPFAIEAVMAPEVTFSQPETRDDSPSKNHQSSAIVQSVIEYFQSLREFINKDRILCESKDIEFVPGMSDTIIPGADFASVSSALENLSDSIETLPPAVFLEYLWVLLLYLEFPLLEDTAASLQNLRRFCDNLTDSHAHQAQACSLIIAHFFHQPA
jgi:hypothetical protein